MKIVLEYRNPTPSHCDVVVFLNGANTGSLRLRQDELITFQSIIYKGCVPQLGDEFISRGNPTPPGDT